LKIVGGQAFRELDEDRALHAAQFEVDLGGPSETQQHLKDETDINVIMRRFGYTGAMPVGAAGAVYGDFTGIESYEDAVDVVERAQRDFMRLPANIREPVYVDFSYMPSDLMEWMEMRDEAESAFMQLPAKVRAEFANDAVAFVQFASQPGSIDQLRAWGLAAPAPPPEEVRTSSPPPEKPTHDPT